MFYEIRFSAKKSSGFGTAKVVGCDIQSGSISDSITSEIKRMMGDLCG